jgi:hypothetical protein
LEAFSSFVLALAKKLYKKRARKTLMQLTAVVKFFVGTFFWQLFSSYMYVEKGAETKFVQKICMQNVDDNESKKRVHVFSS